MITTSPVTGAPAGAPRVNRFYFAAWRWHFYAGLYVIPFLLMLATTGLLMLWISVLSGRDGERIPVVPAGTPISVEAQADAALAAVPGGSLAGYIAPSSVDQAALFKVRTGEDAVTLVAVDPYAGDVLDQYPYRAGWYDTLDTIHGTLLLGTLGDRLIEAAASLAVVMLVTGLYLWWPRGGSLRAALVPNLGARGRGLWKSLHATTGIWWSLALLAFLLSGLSWSGIWGERYVQAWSTFPAAKYDAVPLSDKTHASMNHGNAKEVPWALEQTPMPASGSHAGMAMPGMADGEPLTFGKAVAIAREIGFDGRFQLAAPRGEDGVWTISRDSMSNDSPNPTTDRTVHLDRYTGNLLADMRFADYSIYGQAMAVGIALHEGDMGAANVAFNTIFCLGVIFLAVSGVVMWWKRRPAGVLRLAAPPAPRDMGLWKGAVLVGLVLAIAFPLAGIAILVAVVFDALLLSRLPAAKRLVS
ncbi:putative iron-regulated membrane protein [Amaricoccus macauensis]|uniref:Putative iron-regulated membrane protein n=1 Tax=Amaricoccus macauensis TaxID=57001 RepID=A0A840SX94_9RHOB|nr:PepSY domain-containing protein [Amaricoccus macauensis]MBB5223833.1 putative iron-regulated membrane protein [Amaricoccus macauensis]